MNTAAQQLFQDALRLPDGDRAELAANLIESLDEEREDAVESAWDAEIRHRVEELDNGSVRAVSWTEARRMILGLADGPAAEFPDAHRNHP